MRIRPADLTAMRTISPAGSMARKIAIATARVGLIKLETRSRSEPSRLGRRKLRESDSQNSDPSTAANPKPMAIAFRAKRALQPKCATAASVLRFSDANSSAKSNLTRTQTSGLFSTRSRGRCLYMAARSSGSSGLHPG
jgi:hypothetical protein